MGWNGMGWDNGWSSLLFSCSGSLLFSLLSLDLSGSVVWCLPVGDDAEHPLISLLPLFYAIPIILQSTHHSKPTIKSNIRERWFKINEDRYLVDPIMITNRPAEVQQRLRLDSASHLHLRNVSPLKPPLFILLPSFSPSFVFFFF